MGAPVTVNRQRAKLLQKLAEDLASLNFAVYFSAIWKCSAEEVNSAEAKENCLDSKLQKLLARDNCLPVKIAVQRVLKSWAASQLVSLFLLLFTMELARFYVPVAALLSIGVFWSLECNKDELQRR